MEFTTIDTTAAVEARPAFACDPRALGDAVKFLAMRVVERRNQIPIASAIRFDLDPAGAVRLTGCDFDLQATVTLAAKVEAPGSFCIDADNLKTMLAKLRKVDRDALRIELTDSTRAVLVIGRNRFNLHALPADDFPTLDSPTVGERGPVPVSRFTVPAAQFVADLAALTPCISDDGSRFYLNGVAMQVREMAGRERLVMVATNGTEIGIASRPLPAGAAAMGDCLLPRKAVALIGHAAKLAGPTDEIAIDKASRFAFAIGNVEIIAKEIDGTFPDWTRCFESDLAPTDYAEPVLFPDLLPGVPVAKMEKLAKAFSGEVEWSNAFHGRLGRVCRDPDMLFGVWVDPRNSEAPAGYSYADEGVSFTVDGDATIYPVATKGGRIHLSAAQVASIVGDSVFETMEVPTLDGGTVHVLKWLWDDGATRLLTVRPDGRTYAGGVLITRAEIERAMAGEITACTVEQSPVENMPAVQPLAAPQSESEPARPMTPDSEIDAERASEPAPVVDPVKGEKIGLDEQGDCMAAFIDTLDTLPAVSTPTRAKRTPAHERAIRRAWAERKARRNAEMHLRFGRQQYDGLQEKLARMKAISEGHEQSWIDATNREYRTRQKRRRAVLLARDYQRQARFMYESRESLRFNLGNAEARATSFASSCKSRDKEIAALKAELAKAKQAPTYFDDTGMERRDAAAIAFDQGRHALEKSEGLERTVGAAKEVAIRQERAIHQLADELEAMTARAIKAERALAAVTARRDGWPPAVRDVTVNFAMAG